MEHPESLITLSVVLYAVGMIPTHLAMKYMEADMPRGKRIVALALWPIFVNILVFFDAFKDACKQVFGTDR